MALLVKSSPTTHYAAASEGYTTAQVPRVVVIDPQSVSTSYAWGAPVDIVLPRTLGKVIDLCLQMTLTLSASMSVPPTPMWVNRVESSIGGQSVETVYRDGLLAESVQFLNDQDFRAIAPAININQDGTFNSTSLTGAQTFYLPLWGTVFGTAQPFPKGINQDLRIRVVLPAAADVLATPGTSAITSIRLFAIESRMSPEQENALMALHYNNQPVAYQSIVRTRHNEARFPAAGNNEYTLTSFGNVSAGVVGYVRPADSQATTGLGTKTALTAVNLRRENGNLYYTSDLPGQYVESFLMPWNVLTSRPSADVGVNLYLFPFCANLSRALESGEPSGGYKFSGKEKFIVNMASAAASTTIFEAISYDYCHILVVNGYAELRMGAVSKKYKTLASSGELA